MKYRTIVADPPWRINPRIGRGGRALFGVLAFLPLLLLISYAIGSAVKS